MVKAVDFVVLVFIVGMVTSINKNIEISKYDKFSKTAMDGLKGLFAVLIILFHLSQQIDGGILFRIVGETGYLSVAVFFFISGYGLTEKLIKSGGGTWMGLLNVGSRQFSCLG